MNPIYLDYNATTPIAPAIQEAILPFLARFYGNPSSTHAIGRASQEAIEDARSRVASSIGADRDEIVFTSGGTESNNLALLGVFGRRATVSGHLIVSAIEHPAISAPADYLQDMGFEVTVVPCDREGVVDPAAIERAIRPETKLVSIMHANNEVGTVQPIAEIGEICRSREVLLHTDAAQSMGKIRVQVNELNVDLLTIAGHKIYAPKGVGALYIRQGVALDRIMHGANHERGLRPGTENTPYIVALGRACELASRSLDESTDRMANLRDKLLDRLNSEMGASLQVHGFRAERLPNTLSVAFPHVRGYALLERATDVCASTGSACHSGTQSLSPTLRAMGVDENTAGNTIRLSVGWFTTDLEVERAASLLAEAWEHLR